MADELRKYPNDVFPVSVDFDNVIDSPDALDVNSSSVTVYDSGDSDVTSDLILAGSVAASGNKLFATIKGGIAGESYKIVYQGVTDNNYVFEKPLQLRVMTFNLRD